MPTAREWLSTSVVNGKIYAIGGCERNPARAWVISTVEEYDPATDTWKKKADMPTARGLLSTSVVNGKIYAIGGGPGLAELPIDGFSVVYEYDTGFVPPPEKGKAVEAQVKLVTTWGEIKQSW